MAVVVRRDEQRERDVSREEFTTMAAISSELNSIRQTLQARDELDAERRKIDDARDARILDRVDKHGQRLASLEIRWEAFFGENGAFTFVKNKISDIEKRDRWKMGLLVATLAGVIATLVEKH
jgi:hypothetical protein